MLTISLRIKLLACAVLATVAIAAAVVPEQTTEAQVNYGCGTSCQLIDPGPPATTGCESNPIFSQVQCIADINWCTTEDCHQPCC